MTDQESLLTEEPGLIKPESIEKLKKSLPEVIDGFKMAVAVISAIFTVEYIVLLVWLGLFPTLVGWRFYLFVICWIPIVPLLAVFSASSIRSYEIGALMKTGSWEKARKIVRTIFGVVAFIFALAAAIVMAVYFGIYLMDRYGSTCYCPPPPHPPCTLPSICTLMASYLVAFDFFIAFQIIAALTLVALAACVAFVFGSAIYYMVLGGKNWAKINSIGSSVDQEPIEGFLGGVQGIETPFYVKLGMKMFASETRNMEE